ALDPAWPRPPGVQPGRVRRWRGGRPRPQSERDPAERSDRWRENGGLALNPGIVCPLLAMHGGDANDSAVNARGPSFVVSPARPASVATARHVRVGTTAGVSREYRASSLASRAPIPLPRYSGVRPTLSPPRNTPTRAIITSL